MPRPRLTIGTFGDITLRIAPSGQFEARTLYRDWGGRTRQVQATGHSVSAAERELKGRLVDRPELQPTNTLLSPDSLFGDLVTYWLDDIDIEDRISKTTRNLYERNMRTLVLPEFKHLTAFGWKAQELPPFKSQSNPSGRPAHPGLDHLGGAC